MAEELYDFFIDMALSPDLVIPVPIHWSRRAERGFNQSELLAERLEPSHGVLIRHRATSAQVGLSREWRQKNLANAFSVIGSVERKSILLVDDVFTTGQTARECAQILKLNGAIEVGILAFAGESWDGRHDRALDEPDDVT